MRQDKGELLAVWPSGPPLRRPPRRFIDGPRGAEPAPQSSGEEPPERHADRPRDGRLQQIIGIPQAFVAVQSHLPSPRKLDEREVPPGGGKRQRTMTVLVVVELLRGRLPRFGWRRT